MKNTKIGWESKPMLHIKKTITIDIDEFMVDTFYSKVLKELGVTAKNNGYFQMKELILCMFFPDDGMDGPETELMKNISRTACKRLNEKYGMHCNYSTMESCCRRVVQEIFDNKSSNILFNKIFGFKDNKRGFTTSTVLLYLYDYGLYNIEKETVIELMEEAVAKMTALNKEMMSVKLPEKININIELTREEVYRMLSIGDVSKK